MPETAIFYSERATHPAKSTISRLNESTAERSIRQAKLAAAVRTLLEGIGEDPDRDGLLRTPERYAQALLWMTKGYEERLTGKLESDFEPPQSGMKT